MDGRCAPPSPMEHGEVKVENVNRVLVLSLVTLHRRVSLWTREGRAVRSYSLWAQPNGAFDLKSEK